MIKNVVKVPFRKLKHIHHISDIQIRNLKRHTEYEEVFNRLYEKVKENKENAVAYIGGDIAHSKTDMSPELVDQLSRLFKNLSDIVPLLIIAGNHDCNLNNRSRMDVLTPIVENLNHPNLHYLKDGGIYTCADTQFVVWDCWSDEEDFITADQVEGDTKVVLFHGTVDRCETDLGYRLPSDVKITKFDGYDMGLLGDIHKRQHLNKEETISYCGSLVQQNHGEGLDHGYLLWDVPKRKSKYIRIHNDYGYYTMDITEGKVPDVKDMPIKARLRVRVSDTDSVQLKKALSVIQTKYGIKEIAVTRTDRLTERIRDGQVVDVGDVQNPDFQYELIEDYLGRNHIVDEKTLLKIKDINDELNSDLPDEDVNRNIFWKIKKFEWSNMFSYGEDNVIDFTKLNGIIGMFAPNASGKSSLLDAISFCLFDTCSRTIRADRVLNNKKKTFECKIHLVIDDVDYFIERKAKKAKNGHVKVNVDFWMIDDSDEIVSLNGDQRRTTNLNIKRVIGTYDDFVLTALSLQNNSTVFIDKTQKERKDLLAQFMGMGIFDLLYTRASEEINEVSAVLRNFNRTDYDVELADLEKQNNQYKEVQQDLRDQKKVLTDREKELSNQVIQMTKKLKPIDESITDIDKLESGKDVLEEELLGIDTRMGSLVGTQQDNKTKLKEFKRKIDLYSDDDVNGKYLQLTHLQEHQKEIKVDIDKLKIEVKNKLDKIEKLGHLEYNPDCSYCMSNPFTLDAIDTQESLDNDKGLARNKLSELDEIDKKINELKDYHDKKVDYDRSVDNLKEIEISQNRLDSESTLLKEKKKTTLLKIKSLEERIQKYHDSKIDIEYNNKVESEIDELKNKIDDLEYQVDTIDGKIQTAHAEIQVNETKKKTILDTMNEVQDLETKYEAYKYYMDAIKRDGVPYELIEKALPTIEGEVNDILSQMVDFNILLEMDGKNINTYLTYDDDNIWPLELSSGMERFISSLAIRVGLINVCNLPRPNFLAIDEGFGNMDSDNLNSVYMLFQYLKSQFQFCFIVSHIESMRDTVDSLLEIKKEKGFSQINFD